MVRAKFKAPIRDAVKDLIDFWQHKQGSTNCGALDRSIAKGNELLALKAENKNAFNQRVEDVWVSPVKRDAKITNQRGKLTKPKCWSNTPMSFNVSATESVK